MIKFEAGYHVTISKHKNIFAKGYTPNWFEKVFSIKKFTSAVSWTYISCERNGDKMSYFTEPYTHS